MGINEYNIAKTLIHRYTEYYGAKKDGDRIRRVSTTGV